MAGHWVDGGDTIARAQSVRGNVLLHVDLVREATIGLSLYVPPAEARQIARILVAAADDAEREAQAAKVAA